MLRFRLPTWATVGLSLLAGLASVLNQTTFGFVQPWRGALTVALLFLAGLGITPLTGASFANALHISQNLATLLTAAMTAAALAVTTLSLDVSVRAIIVGALTVLAGLGFGTAGASPAPAPAPPPTP